MAIGKTNAVALLTNQDQPVPESPTTHKVITIDPFGVVNEQWVEHGTNAIVPTPRVHEYLTFVEYNQSFDNVTEDRVIGATYNTTDGKTYVFISVTSITGLDVDLHLTKNDTSTLTIDWGDGTTSDFTNSGYLNTGNHTYSVGGDYIIKMWISAGSGTYNIGGNAYTSSFCGGSIQNKRNMLSKIFLSSESIILNIGAFYRHYSLSAISLSNNSNITNGVFNESRSLHILIIPKSYTIIPQQLCYRAYTLKYCSLSPNITNIYTSAFEDCYLLQYINFYQVISIGESAFARAYNLQIINPMKVLSVQAFSFNTVIYATQIIISAETTSIQSASLANINSVEIIKIYGINPPSLAASTTLVISNHSCKIYVPDVSVTAYKTATNWAIYANYIYPLSDIGE